MIVSFLKGVSYLFFSWQIGYISSNRILANNTFEPFFELHPIQCQCPSHLKLVEMALGQFMP